MSENYLAGEEQPSEVFTIDLTKNQFLNLKGLNRIIEWVTTKIRRAANPNNSSYKEYYGNQTIGVSDVIHFDGYPIKFGQMVIKNMASNDIIITLKGTIDLMEGNNSFIIESGKYKTLAIQYADGKYFARYD